MFCDVRFYKFRDIVIVFLGLIFIFYFLKSIYKFMFKGFRVLSMVGGLVALVFFGIGLEGRFLGFSVVLLSSILYFFKNSGDLLVDCSGSSVGLGLVRRRLL